MDIQPIETQYKGYRFRSRLEARWAVFFDALGLNWEYEKEGYVLEDGTKYLPDFWFNLAFDGGKDGWGNFVEIKATEPTTEQRKKLQLLAKGTGHTAMCFWGQPSDEDNWHATIYKGQSAGDCWIYDGQFIIGKGWCFFMEIGSYTSPIPYVVPARKTHHLPFGYQWAILPEFVKVERLRDGFKAFRAARFEFGEGK